MHLFVPHELNDRHPHALRQTTVLLSLAFALIVQIGFLTYETSVFRSSTNIAAVLPGAIALLTNNARAEASERPLSVHPVLSAAAQKKADDMASKGYFAHQEPNGNMPWHWFKEEGYNYIYAGENLAVNFSDTEQLVNAWLASPTHRDNIVKPQYEDIGIGMATGTYKGKEAVFVVQFFGARKQEIVSASVSSDANKLAQELQKANPTADVVVLGEQTSSEPAPSSWIQKIKTSPRTMNMRLLAAFAVMFAGFLAMSLWPRFQAHPHAIRNGFAALAILTFFFAFQNSFLGFVEVPSDGQAAAAAAAQVL